ncbi:MAG: EAL domain-containing protein [Arcobacteraceae bacterium]
MIEELINNNKIKIFFQPIVSIKNKKIFSFEALTRAFDENDDIISPMYLFKQAKKEHLSNKLDSYVRELALDKFLPYHEENKDILLFLNFESSFIDSEEYHQFIEIVKSKKINPSNVVLEIKEDEIRDNNAIKKFVDLYRKHGFIIAIDDFGTGYSSFDRLSLIQPDIVKIDRSLIYDIDKNFINAEILHAISNMCHKIGAIVLAEGVESKDEILNCMAKDIDIFQGFYFAKPKDCIDAKLKDTLYKRINTIGDDYKDEISNIINKKRIILNNAQKLCNKIINIYNQNCDRCSLELKNIISENEHLEAIYKIDFESGLQFDDTIINIDESTLFRPTKHNDDHSLKEYYFIAKNSSRRNYLSTRYVSKASGHMCRTYSAIVEINNSKYILCLDIVSI